MSSPTPTQPSPPSDGLPRLRLNPRPLGLSVGLFSGAALFLATNWLVVKGGATVGPHLALLRYVFPGFRVSFLGSLVGFAYAFLLGGLLGWVFGWVYNQRVKPWTDVP